MTMTSERKVEFALITLNMWLTIGAALTAKGDQVKCCTPSRYGACVEKSYLDAEECRDLAEAFAVLAASLSGGKAQP